MAQGPVEWEDMGWNLNSEGSHLTWYRHPAAEAWGFNGIRDPSSPRRQRWRRDTARVSKLKAQSSRLGSKVARPKLKGIACETDRRWNIAV